MTCVESPENVLHQIGLQGSTVASLVGKTTFLLFIRFIYAITNPSAQQIITCHSKKDCCHNWLKKYWDRILCQSPLRSLSKCPKTFINCFQIFWKKSLKVAWDHHSPKERLKLDKKLSKAQIRFKRRSENNSSLGNMKQIGYSLLSVQYSRKLLSTSEA